MTDIIVPSNPKDVEKLKKQVEELVDSFIRVDSEKNLQKEILETASEESGIDKKYIKRVATEYFKDTFDKKQSEEENYTILYETLIRDEKDD